MIRHAPGRRLSEHNTSAQTLQRVDDATRAAIAAAVARLAIAARRRREDCRTGRAKPISGRLSFFTKD